MHIVCCFEGSAQLALMFEREQLETREQFVQLKREVLVAVVAKQHPLSQFDQVSYEQILQNRQIVVASRDRTIKPELLFSRTLLAAPTTITRLAA